MAFSPVYNAEKLKTPLLLIHGAKDVIVDVEHTWRMSRMLDFYNIEHQREIMRTSGHSFRNTDDVKTLYEWVMPFLGTHLQN